MEPARGWIVTTAYRVWFRSAGGARAGIYVLGAADNDTDEYDQHIVAHEFQHFLEDQVSRSDTPGGPIRSTSSSTRASRSAKVLRTHFRPWC